MKKNESHSSKTKKEGKRKGKREEGRGRREGESYMHGMGWGGHPLEDPVFSVASAASVPPLDK